MGFRATLNFRKFKVALYLMRRIYFNFAKSYILSCFLKYKRLKLKLRMFLGGCSVAMVRYCVTKIIPTCSLVTGQFFDTMIVASIDKEW